MFLFEMSSRPRSICRPGRSKSSLDMNRGAIFGDTSGPTPSAPIVQGGFSHQEERDRLRTCYSTFHGSKVAYHNPAKAIASKASSRRLLAGTNEYAEDLTGQRQPLNASAWRSETKVSSDLKSMTLCLHINRMKRGVRARGTISTSLGRTRFEGLGPLSTLLKKLSSDLLVLPRKIYVL